MQHRGVGGRETFKRQDRAKPESLERRQAKPTGSFGQMGQSVGPGVAVISCVGERTRAARVKHDYECSTHPFAAGVTDTRSERFKGENTAAEITVSRDGRFCAFSAQFGIQDGARIEIWDRKEKKLIDLPAMQENPKIHQMGASLTGDGKFVAYAAWARPGRRVPNGAGRVRFPLSS